MRAQGRPSARCTRGLVCNGTKKGAHEHTGPAESIRPSLRNGLTAYGALSPETNSFCLRHRRIDGLANPVGLRENLRRFDTSHGCQNHTLLPYATTPLVLRGSIAHCPKTNPETALQCLARAGAIASTASRTPRIVTTRTPLFDEAGSREDAVDLGEMRSGLFLQRSLDGPNRVESADEIRFCAQRVLPATAPWSAGAATRSVLPRRSPAEARTRCRRRRPGTACPWCSCRRSR